MISRLKLKVNSHSHEKRCTPVGFLLDYENPSCSYNFSKPPVFRISRMFVNNLCGTINYRLTFISLFKGEMLFYHGYIKGSIEENGVEFHEANGDIYDILLDEFQSSNTHLHLQSSRAGMPIQIPLLPVQEGEMLFWDYSRLVCDTKTCSPTRAVQEWLGFLALVHSFSTQFIVRTTTKTHGLCEERKRNYITNELERCVYESSIPNDTPLLWVYYATPKPICLKLFLQKLLSITEWNEDFSRQMERCSPRHEGFYKAALVNTAGNISVSFDYGEASLFDVEVRRMQTSSTSGMDSDGTGSMMKVYYYQPVSFDVCGSPTAKLYTGFCASNKYVPLFLLPGSLSQETLIGMGAIRSDLNELWSKTWHKNYRNANGGGSATVKEVAEDGWRNLCQLIKINLS